MALIVQKFGGTSVGDVERIRNVAQRAIAARKEGYDVVVVVSAMGGETNALVELAHEVSASPDPREYDVLLSTGEQKTSALVAMAIRALGVSARSLLASQIKIHTDGQHGSARIQRIDGGLIRQELERGAVVVVPGFQGISPRGDITTIGRGGSDTSAVALAAGLEADVCEIYTDVEGVFTSDPNVVPRARKLPRVSYDEMLEMSSLGAKILQTRSVRFGKQFGVPIHVRSSFTQREGTWVVPESEIMERSVVSGVTYNRDEAKITIFGVPDVPGVAARIFVPMSDADVVVDVIVQNVSIRGHTDVTFTVARLALGVALPIAERLAEEFDADGVVSNDSIAKISVVGLGMKDHAGVAAKMFQALSDENINIEMINTSEIKISVVVEEKYTELACRTLHDAFELDQIGPQEEGL